MIVEKGIVNTLSERGGGSDYWLGMIEMHNIYIPLGPVESGCLSLAGSGLVFFSIDPDSYCLTKHRQQLVGNRD